MEICISDKVQIHSRRYNVSSDQKPLSTQLSDEVRNVLPVFSVLTECDYANPFYRRSEIQNFKKMFLKPELTTLIQFLKTTILTF